MIHLGRMTVVALILLVIIGGVCAKEAYGHFRDGRRGPMIGCVVGAVVCLVLAGLMVPAVLRMLKDVGWGVW